MTVGRSVVGGGLRPPDPPLYGDYGPGRDRVQGGSGGARAPPDVAVLVVFVALFVAFVAVLVTFVAVLVVFVAVLTDQKKQ